MAMGWPRMLFPVPCSTHLQDLIVQGVREYNSNVAKGTAPYLNQPLFF